MFRFKPAFLALRRFALVATVLALPACGSPPLSARAASGNATLPAQSPGRPADGDEKNAAPVEHAEEAPLTEPAERAALELPTECSQAGATVCTPAGSFVSELCRARSGDLALSMFRRSTPWTRAYLRLNTEAWYTESRLSSPVQLVLDEEVIIVASRSGSSGAVQLVGSASYDVYRWDGKCVSVMADEVTMRRPAVPEVAPIAWKSLTEATREALLADRGIKLRRDLQRTRCNEDSSALRCVEATAAFVRAIADYVRKGGKMPDRRLTLR